MQCKEVENAEYNDRENTRTLTGNPLLRKMSTTLLPTPPVPPATRIMPEVSILFSVLIGDGLDSFSIRNSRNFMNTSTLLDKSLKNKNYSRDVREKL